MLADITCLKPQGEKSLVGRQASFHIAAVPFAAELMPTLLTRLPTWSRLQWFRSKVVDLAALARNYLAELEREKLAFLH